MTRQLADFPLIPRDHLFGNPTRAAGSFSRRRSTVWLTPVGTAGLAAVTTGGV